MDYVIIGGDERFAQLAGLLRARGDRVATALRQGVPGIREIGAGALGEARAAVVNCPPKLKGRDAALADVLALLSADARVFACGPGHPEPDARIVDLWADEALLSDNARLTAEGAVAAAMRSSGRAIRDMRCMVVGWGRIGRALTEILAGLGARATVVTRSEANRRRAAERGAEAVLTHQLARALPGRALVFNTAPSMLLDAAALRRADRDAMLIDLASPPYGIDLRAAWDMGLRAWREPGLPGRYCPQSAARALLRAIERYEAGGEKHD